MNAELELQRIKSQNSIDREKIGNLEAELNKARNLAQVENSKTFYTRKSCFSFFIQEANCFF